MTYWFQPWAELTDGTWAVDAVREFGTLTEAQKSWSSMAGWPEWWRTDAARGGLSPIHCPAGGSKPRPGEAGREGTVVVDRRTDAADVTDWSRRVDDLRARLETA